MATAELRLTLPIDHARDALTAALIEEGFSVQSTPSGSLDVSRDNGRTSPDAGAPTGSDAQERFDVHLTETPEGALASFGRSTGDGDSATGEGDLARDSARRVGERLAAQGVIAGVSVGDAEGAPIAAPTPPPIGAPPAPPSGYPGATGYPGYPGAAAESVPSASPHTPGTTPYAPAPSPHAPATSPYAPAAASGRTNGVAIAAIIMGVVVPIGGIIAGAIALAQIKRTGEKGRGLAIGGIVAGGVITVLSIVAVVVALVVFALFGAGVAATSAAPFDPPAEPGDGGVTIGPSEQAPGDVYTLPVGACLDDISSGFISPSNLVDCAQPHTYEVFGGFFLADGAFPGGDSIASSAYEGCDAVYPDYVGVPWEQSTLAYTYVSPTAETWAGGDREISCMLYDPEVDQTTGSLRGSAR